MTCMVVRHYYLYSPQVTDDPLSITGIDGTERSIGGMVNLWRYESTGGGQIFRE